MGPKKETLLRWVNCSFEPITPLERIQELSDGIFFLQILNVETSRDTVDISPWAKISRIVKGNAINFRIFYILTAMFKSILFNFFFRTNNER